MSTCCSINSLVFLMLLSICRLFLESLPFFAPSLLPSVFLPLFEVALPARTPLPPPYLCSKFYNQLKFCWFHGDARFGSNQENKNKRQQKFQANCPSCCFWWRLKVNSHSILSLLDFKQKHPAKIPFTHNMSEEWKCKNLTTCSPECP